MKKGQIKKLDSLWSKAVKERAKYRCEYCGLAGYEIGGNVWLNSCHIIGRRYRSTRWELLNGMCLCKVHHDAYDQHMPQHDDICKEVIGKKRKDKLSRMKEVVAKNQDFEEIKATLTTA